MELLICVGSACHLQGSEVVVKTFLALIEREGLGQKVILKGSFCLGKCSENGVAVKFKDKFYTTKTEEAESFFYQTLLPVIKA